MEQIRKSSKKDKPDGKNAEHHERDQQTSAKDHSEDIRTIDKYIWDLKQDDVDKISKSKLDGGKIVFLDEDPKLVERLDILRHDTEECIKGLPNGIVVGELRVYIHVADITKLKVDSIINAANGHLRHGGGVARAIADAAGDTLTAHSKQVLKLHPKKKFATTDVIATRSGELPCGMVLHAVGPRWPDVTAFKKDKEKPGEELLKVFNNVLQYADLQEVKSVAIPPISSGIFGVPRDVVSYKMAQAIIQYAFESHDTRTRARTVSEVHCVDIDSDILAEVSRHLHLSNNSKTLSSDEVRNKLLDVCCKAERLLDHVDAHNNNIKIRSSAEAETANEIPSMGKRKAGHNEIDEHRTTKTDTKGKTKGTKETKPRPNRKPDEPSKPKQRQGDAATVDEAPSTGDITPGHIKVTEHSTTADAKTKTKAKHGTTDVKPKCRPDEPSSKGTGTVGDTITSGKQTNMHKSKATKDKMTASTRNFDKAAIVEQIAECDTADTVAEPDGTRRKMTSPNPNKPPNKASKSIKTHIGNKAKPAHNDFTNIKYPGSYLSHAASET